MVTFSHLDPGTDEERWQAAFDARRLPDADIDIDALVVVAAHPDDETLGVAGLMHTVAARGGRVIVVVATDGENSHPASPTHTPDDLRSVRRGEVRDALDKVSPAASVAFLGHTDGGLDAVKARLTGEIETIVRTVGSPRSRTLVVSPWTGDSHRDHRIAGEAAHAVARHLGVRYRAYPIWLWHWGSAEDPPWGHIERVPLGAAAHRAKLEALAAHRSQTAALSAAAGDEPIVSRAMLRHFTRGFETLIRVDDDPVPDKAWHRSTPAEHFADLYARRADPWGFETRWYEERKRAVLLSALPRPRYARAVELGCSTGVLTAQLAERCDALLGIDFAEAALEIARERLASQETVELRRATLPAEWPEGTFDLIVMSEVGYFWDAPDLERAIALALGSLSPDGHLVACHWRHPVDTNPVSGDGVHIALRTQHDLAVVVRHEEDDFLLEVFARPPAPSVARETGML
ncbi:PIG-L family deacetylase [Microbacterium invictum]|uniref:PIG-L family deacetylase n=1 Tax=Microbacterium invictum TaxID=515415 RepID=A0ABZ0VAS3_9MICO|nr:PIG-L family deacetylase [Microbacterium invictum]WQB69665.1 PIG-L family deacetylase [Microbacterium invictum]